MTAQRPSRRTGLARAISKLGYCSRSRAFELIRAGRVELNGFRQRDPEAPVDVKRDRIAVNRRPITSALKLYLVLNKPRGLVTTAADEKGRRTIYSCLGPMPWVAPVGRLDKASEGLLLLTNDSEWAARITDPVSHLDKTYHVQVGGKLDAEVPAALLEGVMSEGEPLRAKRACVLRGGQRNTWLEIVLDEGKNRHIRRMLAALGMDVLRLVRVAIGPLALGDLPKGAFRPLTWAEKQAIDELLSR